MSQDKWIDIDLGSIADVVLGGTPSTAIPDYWIPEIDWVTAKDISETKTAKIFITERKISKLGLKKSPAKILPPLTSVIIARGATMGKCRMLGSAMALNQTCYGIIARDNYADPIFIYYFLSNLYDYFRANAHGSVFDTVIGSGIREIKINLPPLPEQRTIAGILGALDDKIELNRRMNATLESIARAVFRQWFVENMEVGKWKIGHLSDIAYVVKGVSYRSVDLVEDSDTALVTLKSMERGGGYREDGLKPYIGEYKPEQKLSSGEVVIAHTDLTQAADVIGRAARIETSEKHPNLVASLDMAIVRPKEKPYTNEYLYGLLSQVEFSDHAYGYTNGTTVLHLSTKALPNYQCRIPPKNIVEEFSKLISPIFLRIDNNKMQSRSLANLRDTLLPKLMRGEVKIQSKP